MTPACPASSSPPQIAASPGGALMVLAWCVGVVADGLLPPLPGCRPIAPTEAAAAVAAATLVPLKMALASPTMTKNAVAAAVAEEAEEQSESV